VIFDLNNAADFSSFFLLSLDPPSPHLLSLVSHFLLGPALVSSISLQQLRFSISTIFFEFFLGKFTDLHFESDRSATA
jgi:hypothetical protein